MWSWSSNMRLNSLKSPWIRPWLASLTMSSMNSLYNAGGSCNSCTWHLEEKQYMQVLNRVHVININVFFNIFMKESWIVHTQWISIDKLHHHCMSVIIHRSGNRKTTIIQCLGGVRTELKRQTTKTLSTLYDCWCCFLSVSLNNNNSNNNNNNNTMCVSIYK